MTGFWFLCTLLVIESTAILAESLEKSELISFTRTKRQMRTNNNMCSGQKLLLLSPEGAILESGERGNNISFHVGEKAKFVCKDGYWQVGELQSFICQEDGKWKEYSKNRTGTVFNLFDKTIGKGSISCVICKTTPVIQILPFYLYT